MKRAIVIGSTGMVGLQLVKQLIDSDKFSEIVSISRKSCGLKHPKLNEHLVDFDKTEEWKPFVQGDVLFSTLGTTLATAGSKDAQYKVDFTYQLEAASAAIENGVRTYVLVSSANAKSGSGNFYIRMKGQLEDEIKKLRFDNIIIMQPGQLDGERDEIRKMEKTALRTMYTLNKMGLFRRFRPIQAHQVACAMIIAAGKEESKTYVLDDIFKLIE